MATRNLNSNSAVFEIWPIGELLEASTADEIEDPPLEREEPPPVEAIAPPATPIMVDPVIEWKTDPFQGKFNPGTKTGHQMIYTATM